MKMSSFIIIATVFVWAGCLAAISFMESWLKFRRLELPFLWAWESEDWFSAL